jgi:hypothetical protein
MRSECDAEPVEAAALGGEVVDIEEDRAQRRSLGCWTRSIAISLISRISVAATLRSSFFERQPIG